MFPTYFSVRMQTVPTNCFSYGTMPKKGFEKDGRKKGPWMDGEIGNQPLDGKICTHQKRRGSGAARSLVLPPSMLEVKSR